MTEASTTNPPDIIVLPARHCRRSRVLLRFFDEHGIPYTRIPLESAEGRALAERYRLRASPGILVNGRAINPFDLLEPPHCRVNAARVRALLGYGPEGTAS